MGSERRAERVVRRLWTSIWDGDGDTMELFGIRFEAYKDPTENIADFSSCVPEASSRRTTYDPEGIKDACSWKLIRCTARWFWIALSDTTKDRWWAFRRYVEHIRGEGRHSAGIGSLCPCGAGIRVSHAAGRYHLQAGENEPGDPAVEANPRVVTPRAEKATMPPPGPAATQLPRQYRFVQYPQLSVENWSRSAYYSAPLLKGSRQFITMCRNPACSAERARHWHRS
ncbi:hypothetical protein CYMTET_25876 [Cymbomonas tetramitiformis]|uniref:Uncharacterized protein n=1 Tax=Cymbomonas tetramitiformis TaxID=36881 RepID=A0AAE0FTN1_9CHLO|nr:hypothetical protein CYMTET_25876 [Cymbomonas tetramitiformis]